MNRVAILLALSILTILGATENVLAQPPTPSEVATANSIASEINNLSASVDHLTQLLEKRERSTQQDILLQKLEIAIAYLNFRSRRIIMLESELEGTKGEKERMLGALQQWDLRDEQLKELANIPPQSAKKDINQKRENIKLQRKIISERITSIDSEIIDLQNRIQELQYQIDSVERFVQKNLEL